MNNYQKLCNNMFMPVGDKLLNLNVSLRKKEIEKLQWKNRIDVENYKLERFKNLIKIVSKSVPFYQKYFQINGLQAQDFTDLGDITKLPIINKKILRDNYSDLHVSKYQGKTYEMKSSGSTGTQSTVLIDNAVNTDVLATQLLFWSWGGFFMGERHLQTGMSLDRGLLKKLKDYLFRCTYTSAFELTDKSIEKIVQIIHNKQIKYLFGYASSIYVIACYLEKKNLELDLTKIFTWGDCLFPHYREKIEKTFNSKVSDCYGLGEGFQVACQCEQHKDLHIAEHHTMVEIVDTKSSKVLDEDKYGRVVVTRFEPGPMPLIRYETGDLSAISSKLCKCGRNLELLKRVLGRDTDVIHSPAGDKLIVHFFTQLFEMIPEIRQFQVRQETSTNLEILYVPGQNFKQSILDRIKKQIDEKCIYKFAINFKAVESIPLEKSNKRRFVISKINESSQIQKNIYV